MQSERLINAIGLVSFFGSCLLMMLPSVCDTLPAISSSSTSFKRNQALIIASAIALHSGVPLSVLLMPLGDLAGYYYRLLIFRGRASGEPRDYQLRKAVRHRMQSERLTNAIGLVSFFGSCLLMMLPSVCDTLPAISSSSTSFKRNQALIIASAIALHSGVPLSVLLVPLGDLAGYYYRLLIC